jgi:hypothetical protein
MTLTISRNSPIRRIASRLTSASSVFWGIERANEVGTHRRGPEGVGRDAELGELVGEDLGQTLDGGFVATARFRQS